MYFKKNLSIKKFLLFILFLLQTSIVSWSQTQTYSYTFNSLQFSDLETKNLGDFNWTLSGTPRTSDPYFQYVGGSSSKGQQLGSEANSFSNLQLKTSEITGNILSIKITSSRASSSTASMHAIVGDNTFTPISVNLTTTNAVYEFLPTVESSGEIKINWSTTSGVALYIKKIEVVYTTPPPYELEAERLNEDVLTYIYDNGPSSNNSISVTHNVSTDLELELSNSTAFEIAAQNTSNYQEALSITDLSTGTSIFNLRLKAGLEVGDYSTQLTADTPLHTDEPIVLTFNGIVTPQAPIAIDASICGEVILSELPIYNSSYTWYAQETSTTPLLADYLISSTQNLYVSQIVNGIESEKTMITISIFETPTIPVLTENTFCGAITINDITQNGWVWYNSSDATEALANTFAINETTTLYVENANDNCTSERVAITITINTIPSVPVLTENTFCGAITINDITQNGWAWYNSADATEAFANTFAINETTTLYVENANDNCTSERVAITIIINTIPTVPVLTDNTFCGAVAINDITQDGWVWYNSADATEALANTFAINETTTLYVENTNENCTSERVPIAITINSTPTVPVLTDNTFCGAVAINDITQDGWVWYNSADATEALANTFAISETTTLYVENTNENCASERVAITITINTIPTTPALESITFCGAVAINDITQNGWAWYSSADATQALANTFTISETTTLYVENTNENCASERVAITITINSIPTVPVLTENTFCGAITINDITQNGWAWYNSSDVTEALANTFTISETTTLYVENTNENCASERVAIAITINSIPTVPVLTDNTFCGAVAINDITQDGWVWYNSADATEALANTFAINETTTLYVENANDNCTSERVAITITINTIPSVPVLTENTFCGQISISEITQDGWVWYNSSDATEALANTFTINETTTLYVENTNENCASERVAITIIINSIPTVPVLTENTFCGAITINDITQNGWAWYNSSDATEALANTFAINETTTLYVENTNNNCESERVAITITINSIPTIPVLTENTFCGQISISEITQDGWVWYNSSDATEALANTFAINETTTLYVENTNENCASERVAIAITINSTSTVPVLTENTFCEAISINDITQNGWVWYNSSDATEALANTFAINETTTLYVENTNENCASERVAITITINTIPTVPVLTENTFCGAITINNITQNGWVWYNSSDATEALANTFTISETTTLYVENTNENCTSERVPITITINSIPTVPVLTENTFCGAITINDITQNGWAWYNSSDATQALANTFTISETTTLYVENTNENCTSERVPITITINSIPTVPVLTENTFCGAVAINDITQNGWVWYNSSDATEALANAFSINETTTLYVENANDNCTSERVAIAITINSIPTVPVLTENTFCGAITINDITQNGWVWYSSSDATQALANTFTINDTTTLYVENTNDNCTSERVAIAITINSIPNVPVLTENTFCGAITINDITQNGWAWYSSADATEALANTFTINETTTLYVENTNENCTSERVAIAITINSIPTTPVLTENTFCGQISISEITQDGWVWYNSAEATDALANSTIISETITLYVENTNNNCTSARVAITITINSIPTTPVLTENTFCGQISISEITQDGWVWYNSAEATEALANSTIISETITLYVENTNNNCESERVAITITINSIPTIPVLTENTFCGQISISEITQDGWVWYNSAEATDALANSTIISETITLYVEVNNGTCSSIRSEFIITIHNTPAPNVNTSYNFCFQTNPTLLDLNIAGDSIVYYESLQSTLPLSEETLLEHNHTYYISQIINGCESLRVATTVYLFNTPAPTANSAQEFCFGSTIGDIAINCQNIKWYESLDSTTPLAISAPLSEGVYYATQTLNNCESIERKAVVISLTEAPILETTTLAICSNTTLIDIVLDEYSYSELSWYVSEHSNIALPPNYMVNNQQLLYVKINSSLCTSFKQAISFETLPIVPIPNINNQVICGSGTIADLVVFGAENTIIEWFASAHSNVVLSPNTPLTTGTYYVSQKIGGCSSSKKAVFVKVISKTAPIIGSLAVCEGTLLSEVNLPYLPNATYEWYVSPTSTNQLSGNTVIQTGYYYIARNQENCISERRQVFIQVNQIPNAPTGNTNQLIELPATVADIVMNENNIIWYNSYEDALDNIQPLSPTTALHQNTILYGVIVNANGCRSLPTAVSINVYLNTPELDLDALRIYPNPVNDWLNISYKENVKSVIIYDLTGRLIYRKDINSPEIKIDMSGFAKTTYLLKVSTNTESSTIKIIKK